MKADRMKNLGTLYRFELGKIIRRKTTLVTVGVVLLLILLILGLDSVGGYYINGVRRIPITIGTRFLRRTR